MKRFFILFLLLSMPGVVMGINAESGAGAGVGAGASDNAPPSQQRWDKALEEILLNVESIYTDATPGGPKLNGQGLVALCFKQERPKNWEQKIYDTIIKWMAQDFAQDFAQEDIPILQQRLAAYLIGKIASPKGEKCACVSPCSHLESHWLFTKLPDDSKALLRANLNEIITYSKTEPKFFSRGKLKSVNLDLKRVYAQFTRKTTKKQQLPKTTLNTATQTPPPPPPRAPKTHQPTPVANTAKDVLTLTTGVAIAEVVATPPAPVKTVSTAISGSGLAVPTAAAAAGQPEAQKKDFFYTPGGRTVTSVESETAGYPTPGRGLPTTEPLNFADDGTPARDITLPASNPSSPASSPHGSGASTPLLEVIDSPQTTPEKDRNVQPPRSASAPPVVTFAPTKPVQLALPVPAPSIIQKPTPVKPGQTQSVTVEVSAHGPAATTAPVAQGQPEESAAIIAPEPRASSVDGAAPPPTQPLLKQALPVGPWWPGVVAGVINTTASMGELGFTGLELNAFKTGDESKLQSSTAKAGSDAALKCLHAASGALTPLFGLIHILVNSGTDSFRQTGFWLAALCLAALGTKGVIQALTINRFHPNDAQAAAMAVGSKLMRGRRRSLSVAQSCNLYAGLAGTSAILGSGTGILEAWAWYKGQHKFLNNKSTTGLFSILCGLRSLQALLDTFGVRIPTARMRKKALEKGIEHNPILKTIIKD